MEKAVAQKKIEELSKELHEHNHLYYVLSNPVVSDFQFDTMLKELQALEKQFPEFLLWFKLIAKDSAEISTLASGSCTPNLWANKVEIMEMSIKAL